MLGWNVTAIEWGLSKLARKPVKEKYLLYLCMFDGWWNGVLYHEQYSCTFLFIFLVFFETYNKKKDAKWNDAKRNWNRIKKYCQIPTCMSAMAQCVEKLIAGLTKTNGLNQRSSNGFASGPRFCISGDPPQLLKENLFISDNELLLTALAQQYSKLITWQQLNKKIFK